MEMTDENKLKEGIQMEQNVEVIKDGLSYEEELKLVSKRFNMTEVEAVESIIHEIYISGLNLYGFHTATVNVVNLEDIDEEEFYEIPHL